MPFLPFIPFLDCAEVVMQGVQGGVPSFMTFGCRFSGPIAPSDLLSLISIFDTWYHANLQPHTAAAMAYLSTKATDLTTATGSVQSLAMGAPQQGSAAGAAVSANAALTITLQTALRGRSYRGRNYVPGMPVAGLATTTQWNTVQAAAIQADWLALGLALAAGGWTHVVLSRYLNGVRRTVGVATAIQTYRGNTMVATQRKRIVI